MDYTDPTPEPPSEPWTYKGEPSVTPYTITEEEPELTLSNRYGESLGEALQNFFNPKPKTPELGVKDLGSLVQSLDPSRTPLRSMVPRYIVQPVKDQRIEMLGPDGKYLKSVPSIPHTMVTGGPKQGFPTLRFNLPIRVMEIQSRISLEVSAYYKQNIQDILDFETKHLLQNLMIQEEKSVLLGASSEMIPSVYTGNEEFIPTIGGFLGDPITPHEFGYNGILSQMLVPGCGSTIREHNGVGTLLENLFTLVLDMMENEALPDKVVLHPRHILDIQNDPLIWDYMRLQTMPQNPWDVTLDLQILHYQPFLSGFFNRLVDLSREGVDIDKLPSLELVADPTLPEGNILVVSTKLPEEVQKYVQGGVGFWATDSTWMTNYAPLINEVPGPWSFGLVTDYTSLTWLDLPYSTSYGINIGLSGAFRLHAPYLFGWLRGIPVKEKK